MAAAVMTFRCRLAKNFLMGRSNINLTADLFNVSNNNVELHRNRVVGGTCNRLNQNLSSRSCAPASGSCRAGYLVWRVIEVLADPCEFSDRKDPAGDV